MLSIGKLATGQANYYLRLADGRVDRATSVASGVEDYYAGEDSAGEWLGGGTLRLSLKGKVEGTALHTVLAGNRPADRRAAARHQGHASSRVRSHVLGAEERERPLRRWRLRGL